MLHTLWGVKSRDNLIYVVLFCRKLANTSECKEGIKEEMHAIDNGEYGIKDIKSICMYA